jgi:GPH family glycoside/pentoside/hexuronide:cation symporter
MNSDAAPDAASPASALSTPHDDRIPASQKVGYGLGSFIDMWGHWNYPTFAFQVFNIFLGLNAAWVGLAVVLNRVFDGVSDPLFGWLSDNTRSRWGRRRPYLLVGAVVAGLGLPLLVAVGPGWGSARLFGHAIPIYFWFMLGSSALYLPLVSCFNMPYSSLGYELTPDYHERTRLFSWKYLIQKVPEMGLFFTGQFLSMAVWVGATRANVLQRVKAIFTTTAAWGQAPRGANPNMLIGAQVYCVLAGVVMVATGLACFVLVRERYYGKLAHRQAKVSIRETVWQTLRCRPFRIQVIMTLAYSMGLSMVGTLGLADTLYYVCQGNLSEGYRWNFRMGLMGMAMGAAGVPTFAGLARRLGKRHAMMIVFAVAIGGFVASWWLYTPAVVWLQMLSTGLTAFIGAGFWTLRDSINADIVDYDELGTGKRREGAFAASINWIAKVGMAVGAGVSFEILSWLGFDPKRAGGQTEHTLFMIRFLLAAIPIVGLGLALVALAQFPLTQERMAEIRRELEKRRGTV